MCAVDADWLSYPESDDPFLLAAALEVIDALAEMAASARAHRGSELRLPPPAG